MPKFKGGGGGGGGGWASTNHTPFCGISQFYDVRSTFNTWLSHFYLMHPVSHVVKYTVILKLAMALRKYTTSNRTESSSDAAESEPKNTPAMMIMHQAQVKGYVLSLTGSTRRNGRSLFNGYTMMKILMGHFAVYAKNGHTQPPH